MEPSAGDRPHAAVTHGQLQLRERALVQVGPRLHLGVTDCQGGVRNSVGCVRDSFAHHCHACHPGKVGHFVLQGTLQNRPLGLCR